MIRREIGQDDSQGIGHDDRRGIGQDDCMGTGQDDRREIGQDECKVIRPQEESNSDIA